MSNNDFEALEFTELPPMSLYIHLPWCVRKCPYCDFNSHAIDGSLPEKAYIEALMQDLDRDLNWAQGRKMCSVFFGGGTPSLFSPDGINSILTGVGELLDLTDQTEITLEVNPGTVDSLRLSGFRQAGVNRLSIGIQSFDDEKLKSLGRIHNGKEARLAIEATRKAGFSNFNLDLIHGLPSQTTEQALRDLAIAISSSPAHISWYQLTIEPNTEFYSKPPQLPDEDLLWDIFRHGRSLLKQQYDHYEVSAFCIPGSAARHNLNYWQFGDYLGIGAGAHGKITLLDEQSIIRSRKIRQPNGYIRTKSEKISAVRTLETSEIPLEFMMNALRLTNGVTARQFTHRAGLPIESIASFLRQARSYKLLRRNRRIQPTQRGLRYLNNLLELL